MKRVPGRCRGYAVALATLGLGGFLVGGCGASEKGKDGGIPTVDGGGVSDGNSTDAVGVGSDEDVGTGASSPDAAGGSSPDAAPIATIPSALVDPSRVTEWNPGILSDGQLHMPLGSDGLPVRTTVCKTISPSGGDDTKAIQAALNSTTCVGQVVALSKGKYTVSSTITLTQGVVLRGAGSDGASGSGTTIVKTGGGSVLAIGAAQDTTCYSGSMSAPYALTQDGLKETSTISVGASASNFSVGDLALIDQLDDSAVQPGDSNGVFIRAVGRSITERVEISAVDASSGTLTLSSPLHWTFKSSSAYQAMIARETMPAVRWAGIESLYLQGGTNPGYDGQMAGGIDISNAANSWVKDVQTDGTIAGMHIASTGTYRVVVRDSYVHHSANYGFGTDCYGIVIRCGSADNLVENNIVRYMNKPILFSASGGGNVIGYNYADNSWSTPAAYQEVNIDSHAVFPHMELIEGNYAPHIGATTTHGNSGYLTYYRNYSSSQFASPAVFGSTGPQTGDVTCLHFTLGDVDMNAMGNVLGSSKATDLATAALSSTYVGWGPSTFSIFQLADDANHDTTAQEGMADVSYTTLWLLGNYDTVNMAVTWNAMSPLKTLPSSLYLSSKPAWWPAASAWPWAGSDLSPMVGTLPAKARSDMLGT